MRGSAVPCNQGLEMRASRDLTQKSPWKDGRVASVIMIHFLQAGAWKWQRAEDIPHGSKVYSEDRASDT